MFTPFFPYASVSLSITTSISFTIPRCSHRQYTLSHILFRRCSFYSPLLPHFTVFSHPTSVCSIPTFFSIRVFFSRSLLPLLCSSLLNSLKMASSSRPNQLRCSKCNAFRDEESFEKHKSGKTKKLCNRHGRKRELDAIFDDWDNFEARLVAWNRIVCIFQRSLLTLPTSSFPANLFTFRRIKRNHWK